MSTILSPSKQLPTSPVTDLAPVLRELWISFISLTRSHLEALKVLGKIPKVTVLETSATTFTSGDLDGNIMIAIDPANGSGNYEMKSCGGPSDKGSWQLLPDGTARVDGGQSEDMELAVEFFFQKLQAGRPKGSNL